MPPVFLMAPEKSYQVLTTTLQSHGLRVISPGDPLASKAVRMHVSHLGRAVSCKFTSLLGAEYRAEVGTEHPRQLEEVVSRIIVQLSSNPISQQWSSRADATVLASAKASDGSLNIAFDPLDWIMGSPFCRLLESTKHERLIRYVATTGPVMIKPWRYAQERNYWNSILNGGLPTVKKRDPIHEGTFLTHDLHHFLFHDPVIDESGDIHRRLYIAFRMMSEAVTLVLADISAVDAAGLQQLGYDTAKRLIYPVYTSMGLEMTNALETELVEANVNFALTGSTQRWTELGAEPSALEPYRRKYGGFFAGDLLWNSANCAAMMRPTSLRYARWLVRQLSDLPTTSMLAQRYVRNGHEIAVLDMLEDLFLRRVAAARRAVARSVTFAVRVRALRLVAGQAKLFFDFPAVGEPANVETIERIIEELQRARDVSEIVALCEAARQLVERSTRYLVSQGSILSHEGSLYLTHYPHYPPVYINYDQDGAAFADLRSVVEEIFGHSLLFVNRQT